jgi:hypothetical protein
MVRLKVSRIHYYSPLDEKHMFKWAQELSCFVEWDQDSLVLRSKRISQEDLRDLLALFYRYKIPMEQLAQFENPKNRLWLRQPTAYWYQSVFGAR